jgi:NADP-dependent 3-hydroxy acid dehydrogenase YdfG
MSVPRNARLALADIDETALTNSKTELSHVTAVGSFHLDVRDRAAFASAADEVESQLGHVNLLFNNAGIVPSLPVSELQYEQWDLALTSTSPVWSTGCRPSCLA